MITGTSTAVHQRSKTGDIVEAYRPFTFGPGPAPWPLPFTFGPGPAPWPRLFSLGPGPARAPLMEAEGYSRRGFFFSEKVPLFLFWKCVLCVFSKN